MSASRTTRSVRDFSSSYRDHPPTPPVSFKAANHFISAQTQLPPSSPKAPSSASRAMHIKRFTLTSKKNWWMVELDDEEEPPKSSTTHLPPYSTDRSLYIDDLQRPDSGHKDHYFERYYDHRPDYIRGELSTQASRARSRSRQRSRPPTRPPSPEQYNPPHRPNAIFSFPTPSIYSAGPNPTASLQPFTQGSASELFKCIVKKPEYVTLEINGEIQSNASDVVTQFLAELRVYTTVTQHRNLPVFLGCLDGIGMVMEFIEGRTLYQYMVDGALTRSRKCDFHNQLLDAICHVHSFGLSHGDLSTLNIQVTRNDTTLKLFDFGRSVASTSALAPPDGDPVDPFAWMTSNPSATPRVEQIHPGTRPFCAPEILRGECTDAQLADAYSFGMILVCLERGELVDAKPWEQRKDKLPADLLEGCALWVDRTKQYLSRFDTRRRLSRDDMVMILDD